MQMLQKCSSWVEILHPVLFVH